MLGESCNGIGDERFHSRLVCLLWERSIPSRDWFHDPPGITVSPELSQAEEGRRHGEHFRRLGKERFDGRGFARPVSDVNVELVRVIVNDEVDEEEQAVGDHAAVKPAPRHVSVPAFPQHELWELRGELRVEMLDDCVAVSSFHSGRSVSHI